MTYRAARLGALAILIAAIAANAADAQRPASKRPAQAIASMGQPPAWEPYVNAGALFAGRSDASQSVIAFGMHRPITHPVVGLLGVAGEAYGTVSRGIEPGARILITSPVLALGVGADWGRDGRARHVKPVFSYQSALRRGGLLGHGTMLRLDWLPTRRHTIGVALHVPVGQPFAGRTRIRDTDADRPPSREKSRLITSPLSRDAELALARVSGAAAQILAYTNLFAADTARVRYGESYVAAARSYRDALAQAFRIAASDASLGDAIARHARDGLLDDVILPYDALFGQVKERPSTIRDFTSAAHARFTRWLRDSSGVSAPAQRAVASVHARWLGVVEAMHGNLLAQWHDSRLVWLPLQLALTEDQYNEQSEVDALIERVVGRPFSDRNALTYLRSSELALEIARSIFATRDYHVLWTHDFTGRRDVTRAVDEIAYAMVADVYLPALTQAVARYDSTRHMPLYMILLDQFYYESRDGRLWMTILEDPLRASMKLPGNNASREAHLRQRQQELRAAVARSWLLQQDATANGGDRWLPSVVKVHVNITQPSDFSFRSHRIVPPLPFTPDNVMRDHRKAVFYDVTEADPYRGAMILMGVGIGEDYASPTWEDRGYRIRGPAVLEARAAARRALVRNGIDSGQLPPPLRADGQQPVADGIEEYIGRAIQVHNEPGFGTKQSSVARAMLYNLAPPGSVIIVPDPLWVSETWAAMLAGAAARGCRVYVIAPSWANGPNSQPPVAALENDVLSRLLEIRTRLGPQMRRAGGELRVGLYTSHTEVTDVAGRAREVKEGLRRAPWIREVIPFDDKTLAVLDRATAQVEGDGKDVASLAHDERPRAPLLHQKTQLIARPGAIAALVRHPGWDEVLAGAMRAQSQQSVKFADQLGWTTPDVDSAATRRSDALLTNYEQSLSQADRKAVSFYFSLGTQNEDPRGIMMDGEATILVSGIHASAGLVDLYYIMARSTWIETRADLDRLLTRPKGLMVRLARMVRLAL